MKIALSRESTFKTGKISLKNGRYNYEYMKYRRSEYNYATPLVSTESYTTLEVYVKPTITSGKLSKAKNEYLKNLMRKDGADYAMDAFKLTVNIGVGVFCPWMTVGGQIASELLNYGFEIMDSPGQNDDFGIKSDDIGTMADLLKIRASVAEPGQKKGTLIYDIYPTNETKDRLEFYNKVFECYGMKPIEMIDVYSDPEAVDKRFIELEKKISETPYAENPDDPKGGKYAKLDGLEEACDRYYSEKNKK